MQVQHKLIDENTLNMAKAHSPRYSLQVCKCNLCIKSYAFSFSSSPAKRSMLNTHSCYPPTMSKSLGFWNGSGGGASNRV